MKPYKENIAFYSCEGTSDDPHPVYLLSTKFVDDPTPGKLKETPPNGKVTPDKVIESHKI